MNDHPFGPPKTYTCTGPTRGNCGKIHGSILEAMCCIADDRELHPGGSDRSIRPAAGSWIVAPAPKSGDAARNNP